MGISFVATNGELQSNKTGQLGETRDTSLNWARLSKAEASETRALPFHR